MVSNSTRVKIRGWLEEIGKHWQSLDNSSFLSRMKHRYKIENPGANEGWFILALWHGKADMALGDGAAGSYNHQPLGGELSVQFNDNGGFIQVRPGGHSQAEDIQCSSLEEMKKLLDELKESLYFVEQGRNYSKEMWDGK